jgi:hemerythrin superfamily protein
MTILDAIKADHEEAKSLLQTVLATEEAAERAELFKEFRKKITAHNRSEEKVFYHRLEATEEGRSDALEAEVEHQTADRLIEDLSRMRAKDSDKWTARCTVLQELLEHHIEEEESKVFTAARKLFDRAALEKMGEAFAAEKAKHGVPAEAAAEE